MNGRPEEITAITLRRGACRGFCPVYEVTVQADGRATWNGERFVDRTGPFEGEVDPGDYGRVAAFVARTGFFEWDPEFVSGVTDAPDFQLAVVRGAETTSVRQNGTDEPPDFWVIAALVDGLADAIDWQPVTAAQGTRESVAGNDLTAYQQLPAPESCRLVDFDQARVITLRIFPPRHILTVTGTKPFLNMDVDLVPRQFIRRPEYWGIEVVGCLNDPSPAVLTPYSVSLELNGTIGTQGIEIVGASRSERIDIPGEPASSECFEWVAHHDHEPPGPAVLRVTGTCRFPRTGFVVELRRAEPQGFDPADLILDLSIDEPEIGADVITEVEARYEEVTDVEFRTVTIRPGPTIAVQDVF